MSIRRIVADIGSDDPPRSRAFYEDFLGLQVAMAQPDIVTFAAPDHPRVQLSVIRSATGGAPQPQVSIEVADVDALHAKAVAQGLAIVYPLTDEPWGVRRFFVRDPNGALINVLSHRARQED